MHGKTRHFRHGGRLFPGRETDLDPKSSIRPERGRLVEGEPDNGLPVVVERRVFTGATTQVHLRSGDLAFHAWVANSGGVAGDGATHAEMPVDALRLLAS